MALVLCYCGLIYLYIIMYYVEYYKHVIYFIDQMQGSSRSFVNPVTKYKEHVHTLKVSLITGKGCSIEGRWHTCQTYCAKMLGICVKY